LTLAVHPDTLAELGKQFDGLLANPDLPEQAVVVPDETLTVGDIVVRQDGGEIRAGLDAQLARLREELLGEEFSGPDSGKDAPHDDAIPGDHLADVEASNHEGSR
jgi:flagellar biosynthesis/type III secretory pathway protein FliH